MEFQTLNLLLKCGMDFGHRRIRTHGLSDTESLICSYVCSHAGCSQEDVAQALRMDKTTTAKALRSLEDKGLVTREQDAADRRRKLLQLTPIGTERLSKVIHLHDSWLHSVLACLSEEEQAQFESYCTRLMQAAEALLKEQE